MRTKAILRKVAKQYNTTPEEVEKEMKIAIEAGKKNPETQAEWKKRFGNKTPTVSQFINTLSKEIK